MDSIYDINKLHDIDLSNAKLYNSFLDYMRENVIFENVANATKIVRFLEAWFEANPEFKTSHPDKYAALQSSYVDNKWIALLAMEEDELVALFLDSMMPLFTMAERYDVEGDIDFIGNTLGEKLRVRLLQLFNWEDRDALKKLLLSSLNNNTELLGELPIYLDIKEVPPTIANWLKVYNKSTQQNYTQYTRSRFMNRDENVQKLPSKKKEYLTSLLDLMERLRVSSRVPYGMEEPIYLDNPDGNGTYGVVNYGTITKYDESLTKEMEQEVKTYQDLLLENGEGPSPLAQWAASNRPPVQQVDVKKGALDNGLSQPSVDTLTGPDYFSDDDEKDIQQHKEFVQQLSSPSVQYTEKADAIIAELALVFPSPDVEAAVKSLIVSVLRGLRDTMELQTYLQEHDFSAEQISTIANTLKAILAGERDTNTIDTGVVEDAPDIMSAPMPQQSTAEGVAVDTSVNQPDSATSAVPQKSSRKPFLPKLRRSRISKKPIIDDVKLQQSMIMGPVEELRAMDILEFRRLSNDPKIAAQKIKTKIDLLTEESVTKLAEGVEAWRASVINSLYLEIGNESIAGNKPVAMVIEERKTSGQPTLTEDEFNAIADLNQQLRY